jgi:hypothetical protein
MNTFFAVSLGLFSVAAVVMGQSAPPQLTAFFTDLGLSADQRAAIDQGKPVAKVLSWGGPSEVYVFGAIFVAAPPSGYLKAARNVAGLANSPGYLGIGELPQSPTATDVSALSLDPDDLKALKSCKEGDCDLQLPTSSIQAFREAVDWSQPDAATQANALARTMLLDLLRAYRQGGNAELGVYRDKKNPAVVAEQFEMMVGRSASVPDVLPELREYLLKYPQANLAGADSFFYWEKVNFGLKPTIRLNHAVIYHGGSGHDISAVAIKQLYASHYFHTALDVSVCIPDSARRGFYLITLKASEQEGLTGVKGSVLRKVVVDKSRSSLEKGLTAIKQTVEQSAGSPSKG